MTKHVDIALYAIPAVALLAAILAAAAPLAVYTITLAAFGLPHVLSELRYVDRRFSRRIATGVLARLLVLLAAIVAVRTATVFHVLGSNLGVTLELSLVVLLAFSVAAGPLAQRVLACAVALAIGAATLVSPYDTSVTFSILHNLTPLGFLWQILPVERRVPLMTASALGFIGVPALVASGFPALLLGHGALSGIDPVGAGPLAAQLFVYVPRALLHTVAAPDLFAASAVAQCAHYFAVIVVLPFLLARTEPDAQGLAPWPRARIFYGALAVVGALAFLIFASGFAQARALYGIAASFHAWLEIPVLVLALTGLSQAKYVTSPARQDAVLATSETSIAR